MKTIVLIKKNGASFNLFDKTVPRTVESARQDIDLMGKDVVTMTVKSAEPIVFDIGDRTVIIGKEYTLNLPPRERKAGDRLFYYDLTFEGLPYDLMRAAYSVNVDTTTNEIQDISGDSLTGDLNLFLTVLCANANRVFGVGKWIIGDIPSSTEVRTITFNEGDNCLSVLQRLCSESEYNMEFSITTLLNGNKAINVGSVGDPFPYLFEYGKNKGLYDLVRERLDSTNIVTRLNVYGGTRNIITDKYKMPDGSFRGLRLCLAGKKKGNSYIEDAAAIAKYGLWESTKIFDDIYPRRTTGEVTSIGANPFEFVDSTMDFDLNAKETDGVTTKYIIVGMTAKISFTSGNLAGYEFELHSYEHSTKTFTIIQQQDQNGYKFPSETSAAFQLSIGDKYVITDIFYPETYITSAEVELADAAQQHLDTYKNPQVKYSLSVEAMFLKALVGSESSENIFNVGDYIQVSDTDLNVEVTLRVKSFSRDLINEYNYTLSIADRPVTVSVITDIVNQTTGSTTVIKNNRLNDPARGRRNWMAAQELMNKVFDPEGFYYSESIKPLSIDTSMLSVGAKSMQFSLEGIIFQANYGGDVNEVIYSAGSLVHYAILDGSEHPRVWFIPSGGESLTTSAERYIYARCSRSGSGGTMVFSTNKIIVDSDPLYYYFLVGMLSSVIDGARTMSLMYGFTTINGRFIKTGRIQSADGLTYFDLDAGEFQGNFKFTTGQTIEEYLEGQFSNLKVGGRNLLLGSSAPEMTANTTGSGTSVLMSDEADAYRRATPSIGVAVAISGCAYVHDGREHISSIYVRQNSGSPVMITLYQTGNVSVSTKTTQVPSGVWTQITTNKYLAVGGSTLVLVSSATTIAVDYKKAKIEYGTIATDWTPAPEDIDAEIAAQKNYIDTIQQDLQNQVDGVVDSWFYDYSPTPSNYPASEWTTIAIKRQHVGDTFTNTQEFVDDATTPDAGCSWRWVESSPNVFSWTKIADSDAVKALLEAALAKDTADGKRRVFVEQPTYAQAYDIGDLWVNASWPNLYSNDLLRCNTAKAPFTSFNINHWSLASKYTGDESLIDFVNNTFDPTIDGIATQLDRKIESWFQDADPSIGWSYAEKEYHTGDMWYSKATKLLKRYVFDVDYVWETIEDQKAIDAYETASNAQDTADKKRRVFVAQPLTEDEYDIGDLWANATFGTTYSNDLLRCITAKDIGDPFSISHWGLASKYTDDTVALMAAALAKYGGGKMLYRDPTFLSGLNGIALYNANGGSAVTLSRQIRQADNPAQSGYDVRITYQGGSLGASPGLGGFYFTGNQTRPGGIYTINIYAKVPVGYNLEPTYNAIGTGGTQTWLTSKAGTGLFQEYIVLVKCGISGTFGDGGYIYIDGPATPPVNWYVAYATMYDALDPENSSTEYLRQALQGSTDINGGLLATNVLLMKNALNEITGGMSGLSSDNVGMWTGGTYAQAIASLANILFRKDGSGQLAGGKIFWDVLGAMNIGNFNIEGGAIVGYADDKNKIKLHTDVVDTLASLISGIVTNDPTQYTVYNQKTFNNTTGAPYDYAIYAAMSGSLTVPANTTITFHQPTVSIDIGGGGTLISTNKHWRITKGGTLVGDYTSSTAVLVAGGTYLVEYVAEYVVRINMSATVGMLISTSAAGYISYQLMVERSEIGKNGLFSFWSQTMYFYFSQIEGLKYKGPSDLPGVLAAGDVSVTGGINTYYGAKFVSAQKNTGTGSYRINHSIGHTNYSVQVTPRLSAKLPYVTTKAVDYCTILFTNYAGTAADSPFEFLLIGAN